MMDYLDQIPVAITDVSVEELEGDLMLYDTQGGQALHLNGSSGLVWSLCNGSLSVRQVIDTIAEMHPETERDVIASDVSSVLREFSERKVITYQ